MTKEEQLAGVIKLRQEVMSVKIKLAILAEEASRLQLHNTASILMNVHDVSSAYDILSVQVDNMKHNLSKGA